MPSITEVVPAAKNAVSNVNDKASTGIKGAFMYAVAGLVVVLGVCAVLGILFWPLLLWVEYGQPLSVAIAVQIVWLVAIR